MAMTKITSIMKEEGRRREDGGGGGKITFRYRFLFQVCPLEEF
jgi:hypothetical protein